MRLFLAAALFFFLAAPKAFPAPPPTWEAALEGDADALAAARELVSILDARDLPALARHFPKSRLSLQFLDAGVQKGLYGPLQARALLAAWLEPLEERDPRVSLALLQGEGGHLSLLFQWPPRLPEDLSPLRQLVCEVGYGPRGWVLEEAVSP